MVPDYRISLLDTSVITTRAITNHAQSLTVSEVLFRHKISNSNAIAYPSWVPNFYERTYSLFFVGFEASKSRKHINDDQPKDIVHKLLRTHGKVVDHVDVLAQPFPSKVKGRAKFRALIDIMLDELALNGPSDVAEWRLFQAALADGATGNPFRSGDHHITAEAGSNQIRMMWETFHYQEKDGEANWDKWSQIQITQYRRLVSTTSNRVGLAPEEAEKGDLICILHGSSVPVVLRTNEDAMTYRVIVSCYLEGVMRGEAVTWEEDEADTFLLK